MRRGPKKSTIARCFTIDIEVYNRYRDICEAYEINMSKNLTEQMLMWCVREEAKMRKPLPTIDI